MKCRRFGISLNPTKSIFALTSGKLLGHIISKDGIRIDPNRVNALQKVDFPRIRKEIQSLLGKVNFVRRFITNFVEIVKDISRILKKGVDIKCVGTPNPTWVGVECKKSQWSPSDLGI